MSLIEKEPIMKFIQDGLNNKHYGYVGVEIITEVEYAPEIDAVPVIRCKDCIHAVAITNLTVANRCGLGQKNCLRRRGDDGFGFSGVSIVYPDGFCDEGERMDGEDDA